MALQCNDGVVRVGDIVDEVNNLEPVSERLQKTVGSGKDFASLHTALEWVEKRQFVKNGFIELVLDDGVHYLEKSYYFTDVHMKLTSASQDKTVCTVQTDGSDSYVIKFSGSASLAFEYLKVTGDAGNSSYLTIGSMNGDEGAAGNTLRIVNCDFRDFTPLMVTNGFIIIRDNVTMKPALQAMGILFPYLTQIYIRNNVEFIDSDSILFDPTLSTVFCSGTVTLTNASWGYPINTFDFGRVSIAYENAPQTLIGWTGATADRPSLGSDAVAQPYFDTDLSKPIWWTGSEWVDSTGTAV